LVVAAIKKSNRARRPLKKQQIIDFYNLLIDGTLFQEKLQAFKEHSVSAYRCLEGNADLCPSNKVGTDRVVL
jgi:hypothetical protein